MYSAGWGLCDLYTQAGTRELIKSLTPGLSIPISGLKGLSVKISVKGEISLGYDEKILTDIFGKTGFLKFKDMRFTDMKQIKDVIKLYIKLAQDTEQMQILIDYMNDTTSKLNLK